jgi:hypothetical protein
MRGISLRYPRVLGFASLVDALIPRRARQRVSTLSTTPDDKPGGRYEEGQTHDAADNASHDHACGDR